MQKKSIFSLSEGAFLTFRALFTNYFCNFALMKRLYSFVLAIMALIIAGCGSRGDAAGNGAGKSEDHAPMSGAELLEIIDRPGYVEARVADPWHEGRLLARYALVPRGSRPEVPQGITVVNVPVGRAVVFSSVHAAAIDELGEARSVAALADVAYLAPDDPFSSAVRQGTVADIGSSMAPSVEKIIALKPDALIVSPMENGDMTAFINAGIPVIYMADYMEASPIARAAWISLLGELTGHRADADSIYSAVIAEYASLKALAATASSAPVVITERPYSGVWYIPGGRSYKAAMIADAGGSFPWSTDTGTGSQQLSEEAVIARASDASFWLLNEAGDPSDSDILAAMPHARAFSAFPSGVFYCNTIASPLFRDIAFHPERVLRDFVYIFHPELRGDSALRYYKPLSVN